MKPKPMPRVLDRLQTLVGQALSAYRNDRAPDRAERVEKALAEAFDVVVEARSRYVSVPARRRSGSRT